VLTRRGQVCWVDFGEPRGSAAAKRRPAVIVQSDRYNALPLVDAMNAADALDM
jgi:mRNA interferase MazF